MFRTLFTPILLLGLFTFTTNATITLGKFHQISLMQFYNEKTFQEASFKYHKISLSLSLRVEDIVGVDTYKTYEISF